MEASQLEEKVEQILTTKTVTRAQEIMGSRSGLWIIALVSFVESATPVPILTDPFMAAAIILDRAHYLRTVLITTISSVCGGVVAYFTAVFFLDFALQWLSPEAAFSFASLAATEQDGIFLLTILGAFTPIPYTLTAWAVGVLNGSLPVFIAGSVVGRGARYLIVGWLSYRFGPAAVSYAKRSIGITSVVLLILGAIYIWYKM